MATTIGLDLGTTTITGVLMDAAGGQVLRLAQRRNDATLPSARPTRVELDPLRLRTLALQVLAELAAPLAEGGGTIDGLGLTGLMHGLLCVDAEGQALGPLISWQDQRTAEGNLPGQVGRLPTLDHLHARLGDLDWHANGCRIEHGYGAATLFWLVQQDALPAGTWRVCSLVGWLAGQLAGRPPVTDPTLAASWGIYNAAAGRWNEAFVERLGLDAGLLPPVRPSGERLGGLAPAAARETGLPVGLTVGNGLGDSQAAFLGATRSVAIEDGGTLEADEMVFVNLGTGGQVCWVAPEFVPPDGPIETRPLPTWDPPEPVEGHPELAEGRFLRMGASLCGGAAYAWLNDTVRAWLAEFGIEADEETVYARLDALAGEGTGQKSGLRVRTTFLGVRGDPAMDGGAIEGITPDNLRLGALARATVAGMVEELYGLYRVAGGGGREHRVLVAAGGGVRKNPFVPDLLAERFGLPVRQPAEQEIGAVGAALLAAGAG